MIIKYGIFIIMLWFVLALPIFVTFGPQGVYGLVPQTNLNPALDLKFVPFLVMFHIEKYYAYSVERITRSNISIVAMM